MAHRPQTVSLCVAWLPSLPAHSLEQIVHLLISENYLPKCSPGVSSVDTIEAGKHETNLLVMVGVVLFFMFASWRDDVVRFEWGLAEGVICAWGYPHRHMVHFFLLLSDLIFWIAPLHDTLSSF